MMQKILINCSTKFKDNIFKEITKNIEIDLKNIDTPMSKNYQILNC